MSHYEKLAVVIFRVLGCAVLVLGVFGAVSTAIMGALSEPGLSGFYTVYFYTYGAYALAGLVLFALSKPLSVLTAGKL